MNKIKIQFLYFYEQFYLFLKYIAVHPVSSCIMLVGVLFSFGSYAFTTDYYVDSEIVINIPDTNYNWLEIGRYGLVFARKLLGTSWYNPYYTGILMLFFLWLTGMTLSYISRKFFPKLSSITTAIGSLIFVTYPTFSEQYYFHFQSAEITFGLWLSMLAMGLFYLFVRDRSISCFVITLIVYVLTFSIYQSFIPLTLCCYLGIFLVLSNREDTENSVIRRCILGSILHFLLAFCISQGIDQIFFTSSDYLSEQIIWGDIDSISEAIRTIINTCICMLLGQGLFYTALLLLAIIAAVAAFCWRHVHHRKIKISAQSDVQTDTPIDTQADVQTESKYQTILSILSAIGVAITPFVLTLLMGANTAARTQFTYPLAALFLLYYSIQTALQYLLKVFLVRIVATVLLSIITLTQIYNVRLIWNIRSYVAVCDRKMTFEIMEEFYDSYAVCDRIGIILWGYFQPETPYDEVLKYNPSIMFHSVYNLEYDIKPYCYFSTIRVLGYMESLGHKFTMPTSRTQTVAAYIMSVDNLSAYPDEGCTNNNSEAFTLNLGNFSK